MTNVVGVATVPVPLSQQFTAIVESGMPHDLLVGGIPFLLKPSDADPYVRDVAASRKEQFDNSAEAGEQTFGDWWLRSQSSYHGGQGQQYIDTDPRLADTSRLRFSSSRYAYVHEPGEVTIASSFGSISSTASRLETVIWAGQARLAAMSSTDNTVTVYDLPGVDNPDVVALGASGICQDAVADGENIYVAVADSVYRIDATATATQIATVTFDGPVVLGWAKQRLILCVGPKVYIVDPDPPTPPASPAVHYTQPTPAWRYTSVADGPNGIYLAGYSGTVSELSSMIVEDTGSSITLGLPVSQLPVPHGEQINHVIFYLNSLFALSTTQGVRVGEFTPYGQPVLGALLMEGTPAYESTPAGSLLLIAAQDSVWWVDLGTKIDNAGRYAHARWADALADGGPVTSVAGHGTLAYATAPDLSTLHIQTEVSFGAPAELTTSWARFSTVEPKRLYYIRIQGTFPDGLGVNPLSVTIEAASGETVSYSVPGGRSTYEFAVPEGIPAAEAFRLKLTLRDTSAGSGVELRTYQMKALPEQSRQAEIILPLACYDAELANDGREFGWEGFSRDRRAALEHLAELGAPVSVIDRIDNTAYRAVIQRCQFRQEVSPTVRSRQGGLISLVLRRV